MSFNVLSSAQSIKNCYDCKYDSLYTYKYEFQENGDIDGWDTTSNICLYGSWSSFLFGHALDRECYIGRSENFISMAAESKFIIKIIMKVVNKNTDVFKGDYSLTTGRIQWVSLEEDLWDSIKQYDFDIIADGKWHQYELNMGDHTAWVGSINNIRVYPFIDGWKKDCFAISFIGFGSTETYTCSNTNCEYYQYYEHPCKGAGSFGSITSNTSNDGIYTTISGINDSFSIDINNYGYETLNIGTHTKLKGSEMAAILTKKITDIGVGSYAYSIVEYLSGNTFKITSGAIGEDSNIKIKYNNASVTFGFFNSTGNDISVYEQGTSCVDGFDHVSSTLLSTDIINRLIDGNLSSSAYTHTYDNYSISGGRQDYYFVVTETIDFRNTTDLKKVAWENRLKTVIDITHPINANGKLHNIRIGGIINSTDRAKAYIFRPLKNGEYKLIYTFDFIVKDNPQISRDSMFYSIECNEYVQKGDVVGFYNIDIFFSAGKREKPDAMFFQFDGEPSSTVDPGKLFNYGVAGFLYHCFSRSKQSNVIFDIDFGDRINIKELNVFGNVVFTNNTYNIGICTDINMLCDLYGQTHQHKRIGGPVIHNNLCFGLDALTDGEKLAINGEVGQTYGNDSNGLWTFGKHSYFYVNGDDEFSTDDPDASTIGGEMMDRPYNSGMPYVFEEDPISLYTTWDYGFTIPIEKIIIYFKDPYNFRNMELSYYLGDYDATGNSSLEKYFNRIPFYNSITLDGNTIDKDQNEYIYENPTYSKPIFENGVCINGEAIRSVSRTKWFVYECDFGPIDAYGFRIYTNYHKSTRISEIEIYSTFDIESSSNTTLSNLLNISSSKYGDLWSNIEFDDENNNKSVGIIGDSPRYIRFEFISGQSIFQINELEGALDDNVKLEGCLDTVFLDSSKNYTINEATQFELKNIYDIPLDLDIDINKDLVTSDRLLLHSIPDSYENITNSLVGPGGKVYKYTDPHTIKTVYGNCSSGAKCYLLKNLIAGKKYYSNIDNNGWREDIVSSNGLINYSNEKNLKKNVLEFDHAKQGKYFEIGIYSPEYVSQISILKAYYETDLLPIKNIYVGLIEGDINRIGKVSYDNNTHYIEGFTVLEDDFNDDTISYKWKAVNYGNTYPLVESEGGISYSIGNGDYPYIERELDYTINDFELILKINQDFFQETYKSTKHVYRSDELPPFTINIFFLDNERNEVFSTQPIVVTKFKSGVESDTNTFNENTYKISTYTDDAILDVFTSENISKGEIIIRKTATEVTVTSDTGKIFGGEPTSYIKNKLKLINIKYVKITWGSVYSLYDYQTHTRHNPVFYGNRDAYNEAIEYIEEIDPTLLSFPIGYIKCVLESIEIKQLCSFNMYKRLYVEFESQEYVTKFELYGKAFWLGVDEDSLSNDVLSIIGIRKSMDGITYNQVASTESLSHSFCYLGDCRCFYDPSLYDNPEASDRDIFGYKKYISSYGTSSYPTIATSYEMFDYYFTKLYFRSESSIVYDFGKDNNYIFDTITMLCSYTYYPKRVVVYGSDYEFEEYYNTEDDFNNTDRYELLIDIPDIENYSGTQLSYYLDIPKIGNYRANYITISNIVSKGYRTYVIRVYSNNNYISINNIEFKKSLSTNLLNLTLEEYNDELIIDLEKIHTIGWIRHYYRKQKYGGINKYNNATSPTKLIDLQYDNLSFSSSNTDDPYNVVWEVDLYFIDYFSDGNYNDKWVFNKLNTEILFENNNKLSVYSYGDYIQDWYGPTITRNFDKTIAIECIVNLMCKVSTIESGRTIINLKDFNETTVIKLIIEIINGVVESRLYEKDDLIYTGSDEISNNSLNSIKIIRSIKPVTLKYIIDDVIIYEYDMSYEDELHSMDIKFDKYQNFTALTEHYISFVSISIGSVLDYVRWVKLTLENTYENFYGTYIEYLSIYPDVSNVHNINGELNCEWEQFPYDISKSVGDAENIAKYSEVTTNYSNVFGHKVTNIVNGDNTGDSGYWEFDVLSDGSLPHVDIDLGRVVDIKEIRMYHGRFENDEDYKNKTSSYGYIQYEFRSAIAKKLIIGQTNLTSEFYNQPFYDKYSQTTQVYSYNGVKPTSKMLVTFSVQIWNQQNIPTLSLKFYETTSYFNSNDATVLAVEDVIINMETFDDGEASAYALVNFDVGTNTTIGAVGIICENYLELDYWGFNNFNLNYYELSENSSSDFSCYQRDVSYVIQGSTTTSGEDFKYICPTERKEIIECQSSDPFVIYSRIQNVVEPDGNRFDKLVYYKYAYSVDIKGNDYNKYHNYDSVSIRRLRVLFKKWDGSTQTRYNELTKSYEFFTGSYLREIEVYEYNPRVKIPSTANPEGYSYGETDIPIPFISSFDYPIIAFDLGNKYNITQIKTSWPYGFSPNPEGIAIAGIMGVNRPWYLSTLDIRYSDNIYSDPSKVTFGSKDEKQIIYSSTDTSGVVLSYLEDDSEAITEYTFDSNVFISEGSYDVSFQAYLATSESKISIWFEGNNFYKCEMTTVASGISWEPFYEHVVIEESGFYTIKAKQNSNYDENWGVREPILYLLQSIAKQWVLLVHDQSFTHPWVVGTMNYIEMRAGNGFIPTQNSDWWESIYSTLSTEKINLKEGSSAVKINYPGGSKIDKISYRESDCFSQDKHWSVRDKLTVWFYISDISSIEFTNSYIIYGNIEKTIFDYGSASSNDASYYTWRLDAYSIVNGWNKIELKFNDYFDIYPKSSLDEFNLTGSISNVLKYNDIFGLSTFQLYIDGKEDPCTIILDTLKYERTEFLQVRENNGIYLSGNESLMFNINNLSLKRGTVEFDVRLSTDNTGKDVFGDNKAVTLLSIITNSNEIITLFISIGKGLNICVGTIGKDLYVTDTYFSSEDIDNYIGIDGDAKIKVVWSNDGTEMDNNDTFRLYVNNEWLYSISDVWAINSNNIGSIIFGGMTTARAALKTDGSGVFSNIKVYNYCKLDNNVISDTIGANDFLELSKDNENFFKLGDENLPIQFKGVAPGESITAYVRSDKVNNFNSITEATGNLIASWTLIV